MTAGNSVTVMGSVATVVQDVLDWATNHAPHFGLGGGGILLVLIALKGGKGVMRLALMVVGVGAVVAAVLWFIYK